jgi:hypothetical protein
MKINYNVNDIGILKIYDGNKIITEIWGCEHLSGEILEEFVEEILQELEYERN